MAIFVFGSVPDPIQGLRQLSRVARPDGDIWLLEHMRINKPVIGPLMDVLNPVVMRLMGANINRQTVENVERAVLKVIDVEHHGQQEPDEFPDQPLSIGRQSLHRFGQKS